jgi:hypothetical protein
MTFITIDGGKKLSVLKLGVHLDSSYVGERNTTNDKHLEIRTP